MRDLYPEDLAAGVGVRVEVDQAEGSVSGRAGAHVRLGDRVVAAEDDRDRPGRDDLARLGTMKEVKAKNLLRLEGKDYIIKDGDIVYFRSGL